MTQKTQTAGRSCILFPLAMNALLFLTFSMKASDTLARSHKFQLGMTYSAGFNFYYNPRQFNYDLRHYIGLTASYKKIWVNAGVSFARKPEPKLGVTSEKMNVPVGGFLNVSFEQPIYRRRLFVTLDCLMDYYIQKDQYSGHSYDHMTANLTFNANEAYTRYYLAIGPGMRINITDRLLFKLSLLWLLYTSDKADNRYSYSDGTASQFSETINGTDYPPSVENFMAKFSLTFLFRK